MSSRFRRTSVLGFVLAIGCSCFWFNHSDARADAPAAKPNILWLTSEDNGPQLGCYGDEYADTPNLDGLAERSLRYQMCWSNAPVCAPARTTIISGMYATCLGGQHMRSAVRLPEGMDLYPKVLKRAGYYCTNNSKTDYNFANGFEDAGWDANGRKAHWKNRPNESTPFFSIFNFTISHESKIRNKPHTLVHDPAKAPVPSYQPDTPEVRRDWAQYYDRLTEMDEMVGEKLRELDEAGLADSTIVFYYGDHGSGMPRSKRWPFNSGLQVPLIVHVPEAFQHLAPEDYLPGGLSERLVAFVDMGPTAISLAGEAPPESMQGVPFMGRHEGEPKKYLFGYRGRMDERIDMVRTCTDGRFVYMRHFYPDRPYLKHVGYMFQTPTTRIWKEMYDEGMLNDVQAKVWQPKPVEELFDLKTDPDEVKDLAVDPAHEEKLAELRSATKTWMVQTHDVGLMPEAMMHELSGDASPREYATSDAYDVERMADAAWFACDAWGACSESTVDQLAEMAASDNPVIRFWAARGLALGLASHGTVMESSAVQHAIDTLTSCLQDDFTSVQVVACDGLLDASDYSDGIHGEKIAEQLMGLSNAENHGYYAPVEALNVVDKHRDAMGDVLKSALPNLPERAPGPKGRPTEYVKRLLDYLRG